MLFVVYVKTQIIIPLPKKKKKFKHGVPLGTRPCWRDSIVVVVDILEGFALSETIVFVPTRNAKNQPRVESRPRWPNGCPLPLGPTVSYPATLTLCGLSAVSFGRATGGIDRTRARYADWRTILPRWSGRASGTTRRTWSATPARVRRTRLWAATPCSSTPATDWSMSADRSTAGKQQRDGRSEKVRL